jgi:hypothetical protein
MAQLQVHNGVIPDYGGVMYHVTLWYPEGKDRGYLYTWVDVQWLVDMLQPGCGYTHVAVWNEDTHRQVIDAEIS